MSAVVGGLQPCGCGLKRVVNIKRKATLTSSNLSQFALTLAHGFNFFQP